MHADEPQNRLEDLPSVRHPAGAVAGRRGALGASLRLRRPAAGRCVSSTESILRPAVPVGKLAGRAFFSMCTPHPI